jgi:photosystem II stability/assembly factor-like uncharacterized protein
VRLLVADPTRAGTLYAVAGYLLFTSADAGASWRRLAAPGFVTALAVAPSRPATLYAATPDGIYRSADAGRSWRPGGPGLAGLVVSSVAVDPHRPWRVFAGTSGTFAAGEPVGFIFKSTDGGRTWTPAVSGVHVLSLSVAADGRRLWAATSEGTALLVSEDTGESWRIVSEELRGTEASAFAVDPDDERRLYLATSDGEVRKSADGGGTWRSASDGLALRRVSLLAVAPWRSSTLFAASVTDPRIFRSDDHAATWRALPASPWRGVSAMVLSPSSPATLRVATERGVLASEDGGGRWRLSNRGLRASLITALATAPSTRGTVYAATVGGLFASADGGRSWRARGRGPGAPISSLAVDPSAGHTLYAGTSAGVARSDDGGASWSARALTAAHIADLVVHPRRRGVLFAATDAGVFRSEDGGESWQPRSDGLLDPFVWALAIDPQRPSTLYAGTARGLVFSGVWRSTDGGAAWQRASRGMVIEPSVLALAIDPRLPSTLYASVGSTGYAAVLRSRDGGESWHEVLRRDDTLVESLLVDPVTSHVFAGTFRRGVLASADSGGRWRSLAAGSEGLQLPRLAIEGGGRRRLHAASDAGVLSLELPER